MDCGAGFDKFWVCGGHEELPNSKLFFISWCNKKVFFLFFFLGGYFEEREREKTYQLKCDFSAAQSIEENDRSQKN